MFMKICAKRQIKDNWPMTKIKKVFRTHRWADLEMDCPRNGVCLSAEGWGEFFIRPDVGRVHSKNV